MYVIDPHCQRKSKPAPGALQKHHAAEMSELDAQIASLLQECNDQRKRVQSLKEQGAD